MNTFPSVIILLHWDMNMIRNQLPLTEILSFSKNSNCMLVNAPYDEGNRLISEDVVDITGIYGYWDAELLSVFQNETVLLCGGYRSLCIRDAYHILVENGIDVVIQPDWIVNDPIWYTPDSELRKKDQFSFIWEYPDQHILNVKTPSI